MVYELYHKSGTYSIRNLPNHQKLIETVSYLKISDLQEKITELRGKPTSEQSIRNACVQLKREKRIRVGKKEQATYLDKEPVSYSEHEINIGKTT